MKSRSCSVITAESGSSDSSRGAVGIRPRPIDLGPVDHQHKSALIAIRVGLQTFDAYALSRVRSLELKQVGKMRGIETDRDQNVGLLLLNGHTFDGQPRTARGAACHHADEYIAGGRFPLYWSILVPVLEFSVNVAQCRLPPPKLRLL